MYCATPGTAKDAANKTTKLPNTRNVRKNCAQQGRLQIFKYKLLCVQVSLYSCMEERNKIRKRYKKRKKLQSLTSEDPQTEKHNTVT